MNAKVRLILQYLSLATPQTKQTTESPARKCTNVNMTPQRSTQSSQQDSAMDTSPENNSFSALAEEEDTEDKTMEDTMT